MALQRYHVGEVGRVRASACGLVSREQSDTGRSGGGGASRNLARRDAARGICSTGGRLYGEPCKEQGDVQRSLQRAVGQTRGNRRPARCAHVTSPKITDG